MTAGKLKKSALALIIAIGSAVRLCTVFIIGNVIFWNGVFLADRIPKTVDVKNNGEYTLYLQTLGSPGWPFGPQDGRIVLKMNGKTVCKKNFTLHNDGKNMNVSNWSAAWDSSGVTVIISGEEQPDETLRLEYGGNYVKHGEQI